MNIALFGKSFSGDRTPFLRQLVDGLLQNGVQLAVYKPFYQLIRPSVFVNNEEVLLFETHHELIAFADMVFSIGGDGTLLDTLPLIRDSNIPVLGINMGRLGFLSSISKQEIDQAVNQVIAGNYTLEQRSLIQLDNPPNLFPVVNYALNELTIFRKETTSLIVVQVYVNESFVNAYWADGLIIATPTGSTAYSLSAGGPILTPHSANFVITPIATHNLSVRPIVIPDNSAVKLRVVGRHTTYTLSMDSRMVEMDESVDVLISKAPFTLNMVLMEGKDFFGTIRDKLLWGLDIRN
ncbi:MAG: NAD kinase [Bacteroidetes bacterium]|nr:NAD kinase [Bacteroidota bacterium]MBU1580681.1 NAD kinase [Bacteroidota bacterium]MBU2559118.1 NAD kinase [Bacteroidota bacterium]